MTITKEAYLNSLQIAIKRYELHGEPPLELELFIEYEIEKISSMTQAEFIACVLSSFTDQ